MKVALIPPLGWESYIAQSVGVVMALALEGCIDNANYGTAFKLIRYPGNGRKLIILDNGAAEGQQAKGGTINKFAAYLEADEIVLPDVLGSRMQTIAKVHEYYRYTKWDANVGYMGVVQGDSMRHAQQCVRDYGDMEVRRSPESPEKLQPVKTLGIPRRLITATDAMSARIDLANWILEHYGTRFNIHFLGAASVWPQEIKFAAKYAPQVRSLDTSLPFNFALADIDLRSVTSAARKEVPRVLGYMVGNLVNRNPSLVQSNIDTYMTWSRG